LPDTLNEMRGEGVSLYVNCSHPACGRSALVNLDMLIEKLGCDHGAMHDDLVGKFFCTVCRREGRERRSPPAGAERPAGASATRGRVFFTIVQNYDRDRQMRNARWQKPRSS